MVESRDCNGWLKEVEPYANIGDIWELTHHVIEEIENEKITYCCLAFGLYPYLWQKRRYLC